MRRFFLLTVIAITLPLILFAFVGCMKKPDGKTDYGPAVSLEKVSDTMNAQAPIDVMSIKKSQYVSLDESQSIDVQAPFTYYQRLDEVTDRRKEGKFTVVYFSTKTQELDNGTWKDSLQDGLGIIIDEDRQTLSSRAEAPEIEKKSYGVSVSSLKKMDEEEEARVTYHNLTMEVIVMPVPAAVAQQPDCGGLPTMVCRNGLRVLKTKFDRVVWDSETHGIKSVVTLYNSSDIPTYINSWDDLSPKSQTVYPTNQLKGCVQTWIEVSDGTNQQTVPVMRCSEVRDFQFGHD